MRALSLWQPWASAIAVGLKRIETRHWPTSVRGPIAIHAAKRWTADEREFAAMFAERYGDDNLRDPPRGVIVAVARLAGCRRTELLVDRIAPSERDFGNYAPGRFGFLLEDIRPLALPVPFSGKQGFFEVPDDLIGGASDDQIEMFDGSAAGGA